MGGKNAARAAGIRTCNLVKLCVYSISGFFCGLAGLALTSRLGAAESISGVGFEMIAIALRCGRRRKPFWRQGHRREAIVGAFIMQIVQSGLVMLNVPSPIQQAILASSSSSPSG